MSVVLLCWLCRFEEWHPSGVSAKSISFLCFERTSEIYTELLQMVDEVVFVHIYQEGWQKKYENLIKYVWNINEYVIEIW